jgi:hypothetical protein
MNCKRYLAPLGFLLILPAGTGAGKPAGPVSYVSPAGNDSDPGTIKRPWRTIQHAADVAKAGSTVSVRGGKYCELVTVNVSGDPGRFITFRSHPGETAILDGECLVPPEGRTALLSIQNKSYIRIQGFEIRNYRSDDRRRTPAGIFVRGSGSHIELLNNNLHHIETNVQQKGLNAFGIAVYGTDARTPLSDLVIDGNQVHHLKTGASESLVVNGNVTNFRITRNVVHDNNNIGIDVIGAERTAPDPSVDQARDGVVSENLVYNITSRGNPAYGDVQNSDGIYVDGGARILIERNIIHDVDFGIELASEHRGRTTSYVTARNNLIYNCHTAGIAIGGYDEKRGGVDHCVIVNNTLYNNDTSATGTGEFHMQYYLTNNIFQNNIVYAGKHGRLTSSRSGSVDGNTPTVTMDYNLYFLPAGPQASNWQWNRTNYTGLDNFVKATGNDQHSRFADPRFVNLAKNEFRLQTGSPAKDAGTNLGPSVVGARDLSGVPRVRNGKIDIGCYEK